MTRLELAGAAFAALEPQPSRIPITGYNPHINAASATSGTDTI
jgi:hypothetical protein